MILFTLFTLFCVSSGANILLMFPMSPKSHVTAFLPLFKKLSERHNLTMVSSLGHKYQIQNCSFIKVKAYLEEAFSTRSTFKDLGESNMFTYWPILRKLQFELFEEFLELEGDTFLELMEGDYKFDLMISETLYLWEILAAFGHVFNVPVISIDSHPPSAWSSYLTGNVHPYSYVPNYRVPHTDHMTFTERLTNTLLNLQEIVVSYYYVSKQDQLMRKHLSYNNKYNFPPLMDMLMNTSLVLVDSHFSLGYVRPYLPNIVEVGGMSSHAGGDLDQEYQKLLDESVHGVVYITFGTILKTSLFPPEVVNILISALGQLKQTVIMKWEKDHLPNKPKNVIVKEWLPQNGILGHPNCRLFISHGGVHGLTEAIYHKVPLVIIPFASDQFYNALFAKKEGFAEVLSFYNLTTEGLLSAINSVLNNPEFKRNVEKRSLIMEDKGESSLDKAVYWVEYVLRHNGAKHLRPASLDLNIFQYFLLDVIVVIFLFILGFISVLFISLRTVIKFVKRSITNPKQKSD